MQEAYPRSLWLAVTGALFGAFQFGYQVGVLNTALPFIAKDLHYHKQGVLSSAVVLGAAVGAITAGRLADGLGPRHAQGANCLTFLAGSLVSSLANDDIVFLVGRFIAGIGAGAASLYVPRYIAEVSPQALRGWLGSLNQVLINTGILVAYCSGIPYELGFTGFDVLGGVWCSWWRIMLGAGLLPATLQVLVLSWCSESPVWLESNGLKDAADAACLKLWGTHAILPDSEEPEATAHGTALVTSSRHRSPAAASPADRRSKLQEPLLTGSGGSSGGSSALLPAAAVMSRVQRVLQANCGGARDCSPAAYSPLYPAGVSSGWDDSSSVGGGRGLRSGSCHIAWSDREVGAGAEQLQAAATDQVGVGGWDSLFERQYRWMVLLALGLPLLQQASGINTVVFYSSQVFMTAGLPSPIAASIITGAVNLVFTIGAAVMMDRYGRRPLLLVSHTGMALTLGAVSGLSLIPMSTVASSWCMVLLMLVYVAFFAVGAGPVTWVLLSEVLPPSIKGPAASLATAAGWAGNLAVTASFDSLLQHLGLGGTYLLYALLNGAGVAFVVGLVLETKCKSLAEITQLLLLPDRDPRLAALLPALQRSTSNVSSPVLLVHAPGPATSDAQDVNSHSQEPCAADAA